MYRCSPRGAFTELTGARWESALGQQPIPVQLLTMPLFETPVGTIRFYGFETAKGWDFPRKHERESGRTLILLTALTWRMIAQAALRSLSGNEIKRRCLREDC